VEVFIINGVRGGQVRLEVRVERQVFIVLSVVYLKVIKVHLKSSAKFNRDLLLLLENEFVILHVFLSVCL